MERRFRDVQELQSYPCGLGVRHGLRAAFGPIDEMRERHERKLDVDIMMRRRLDDRDVCVTELLASHQPFGAATQQLVGLVVLGRHQHDGFLGLDQTGKDVTRVVDVAFDFGHVVMGDVSFGRRDAEDAQEAVDGEATVGQQLLLILMLQAYGERHTGFIHVDT